MHAQRECEIGTCKAKSFLSQRHPEQKDPFVLFFWQDAEW